MNNKYDVIVIGFGKAGKTLAVKLAKAGKKVALIEKDINMYGGTCINVGCIPSKRLISDSKNTPKQDFEEKKAYYRKTVQEKKSLSFALRKANYDKLIQSGVEILDGNASFIDTKHILVRNINKEFILGADEFIINTGAVSVIPNIEGIKNNPYIYFSDTLMDLEELPNTLTIVGGGYIGLEFAFMYANFGTKVTIIQDAEIFLPREDEDISISIKAVLAQKNIELITAAKITKIVNNELVYEKAGEINSLKNDIILLATGRRPNTDSLECEKAGIALNERGAIITDEYLRTNTEGIWAAGDVCEKLQFTYISLDDSRIILDNMKGNNTRNINNRGAFSYSVFIDPPYSRVGLNEMEAKAKNIEYRVVSLPANSIPKAKVIRETQGVLKALISSEGYILGAQLFCAESYEMINLIKLAMDNKIKAEIIRDFIFTHPTMSESLNDLFSL